MSGFSGGFFEQGGGVSYSWDAGANGSRVTAFFFGRDWIGWRKRLPHDDLGSFRGER
jgi:hypothetical protein